MDFSRRAPSSIHDVDSVRHCRTSLANSFYGSPAREIAEVCGVSIGTAEHCKAGRRKPPTPVLRLWRLYRHRRVLSYNAWDGFRVINNRIFAPGDSRPMKPEHFYLWGFVRQALAEAAPEKYHKLLEKAENSWLMSALPESRHAFTPISMNRDVRFRP